MENRWCIKCGADLSEVMGCYVFIYRNGQPDAHAARHSRMCVECGGNGGNGLSQEAYDAMPYRESPARS